MSFKRGDFWNIINLSKCFNSYFLHLLSLSACFVNMIENSLFSVCLIRTDNVKNVVLIYLSMAWSVIILSCLFRLGCDSSSFISIYFKVFFVVHKSYTHYLKCNYQYWGYKIILSIQFYKFSLTWFIRIWIFSFSS
jgi:hypothetical protein